MRNPCEYTFVYFALLHCLGGAATDETNCTVQISNGGVFDIPENSNGTIPFEVKSNSCSMGNIIVQRQSDGGQSLDQCTIRNLINQESGTQPCQCKNYSCSITTVFTRNDSGTWKIKDENNQIKETTFTVNVTYPTTITNFSSTQPGANITVAEGADVEVICTWQDGNPKRNIFLRNDQNGMTIFSRNDSETPRLMHTIENISCADSGRYSCVAEGTDEKKTIYIWIKCPPQFLETGDVDRTLKVSEGQNAQLQFNISSYRNIKQCLLTVPKDGQSQECTGNRSDVTVRGAPPRLELTLEIRDVGQEDNGTWQLSVGIEADLQPSIRNVANVSFTLDVVPQHGSETNEQEDNMWRELMIISCVVATAAIILCITISVCVCRSRKKTKEKGKSSMKAEAFGSQDPLALHGPKEDSGMIVNEIYSTSDPRGDSFMITNDLYEGSGVAHSGAATPRTTGCEEVNMDTQTGTVTMTTAKAAESSTGDYANVADVQKTKKEDKDRKRKQPKGPAPGPPASKEETSAGTDGTKKNKKELKKDKEASPQKGKTQTNNADTKTNDAAGGLAKGGHSGKDSDNTKTEPKPKENGTPTSTENPTADTNSKPSPAGVSKKNSGDATVPKADAPKTKPDASAAKSDPPKTKPDAPRCKPEAAAAKADAPKSNAEGAAGHDDQREILVDARVPNAEGCLYGQLDFSKIKPRTTIIKDLPSTDYAEIDFKASPPPAPKD